MTTCVPIKLRYNDKTRLIVSVETITWDELKHHVEQILETAAEDNWKIEYIDDENDTIQVLNTQDLTSVISLVNQIGASKLTLWIKTAKIEVTDDEWLASFVSRLEKVAKELPDESKSFLRRIAGNWNPQMLAEMIQSPPAMFFPILNCRQSWETEVNELNAMGFTDNSLNRRLLGRFNGSVARVVQILCS